MRIFGRVDEDDQVSNVYDNRWHMELLVKQNWIGHFTRSFHIERKKITSVFKSMRNWKSFLYQWNTIETQNTLGIMVSMSNDHLSTFFLIYLFFIYWVSNLLYKVLM